MAHILWDITSARARLLLRVYFNVMLILLGVIGDQCYSKKVQLRLLQRRPLDVTHITGWLRVNVPDRCWFNNTSLYEVIWDNPFNFTIEPLEVGDLHDLVTRAQTTSQANGGLEGIYHKVNTDPTFRADAENVVGQWNCHDVELDRSYPANSNLTEIANDLVRQGTLFDVSYSSCWDQYPGNKDNHLVIWSASVENYALQTWEVRAAIDMASTEHDDKVMRTYRCQMNAPAVNWVLEQTLTGSSIYGWSEQLKGKMYENSLAVPPVPNSGAVVASTLDAMVIIAGTYQSSPTGSIPPIYDPMQGCLAPKAQIPGPVILIFILVTLSTVAILCHWLCLTTALQHLQRREDGSVSLASEKPPNGLMDWMRQAVQETGLVRTASHVDLKDWLLVAAPHEQHLPLVQGESTPEDDPKQSPRD